MADRLICGDFDDAGTNKCLQNMKRHLLTSNVAAANTNGKNKNGNTATIQTNVERR